MQVYVNYNDGRWKKYRIDFEKIASAVVGKKYKDAEVSIILTDDAEIHALNKMYRNIDKPTNVLSFELDDDVLLGDIYISLDTVKREAQAAKISIPEHTAHMIVHGMFHLLGYDHLTDAQARVMESKEIKVLKKLGIKNPYEDDGGFSWWKYALCALFGAVAPLGFAPFNMWWITVLSIACAYWVLCAGNTKLCFWTAWARAVPFGAMYAISMFWWTLNSIYVVPELAHQFAIWTIPAIIGIGLVGAIIFTIPFVLTSCIDIKTGIKPVLFAGSWTFVLWLREWFFTGFPWNPVANISLPCPLISNSMSFFGALGLTFVITGLIASMVQIFRNIKGRAGWFCLLFFSALFCLGMFFSYKNLTTINNNKNIVVRIVQPVTTQAQKIALSRVDALNQAKNRVDDLSKLTGNLDGIDLVVYPETTYPFMIRKNNDIMPVATSLHKPVIIGAITYQDGLVYNSLIVSDAYGRIVDVYDKSHLVPFGEYGPIKFIPSPANLTAGSGSRILLTRFENNKNFSFAPAVCYEIIFSGAVVGRDYVDAIINITNDTWFGKTPGTYQHLDMVRRAAIESGVPVIRANYSGISAFVDANGKVISSLPIGHIGVLDGTVSGSHMTIYRLLGRDVWFCIIVFLAFLWGWAIFKIEKNKN